jgi:hypothetical protein
VETASLIFVQRCSHRQFGQALRDEAAHGDSGMQLISTHRPDDDVVLDDENKLAAVLRDPEAQPEGAV